MMINIKELLLNPCLLLKQIRGSPKMDFYSITRVFWWVLALRLLKRARVLSEVGGMFIDIMVLLLIKDKP